MEGQHVEPGRDSLITAGNGGSEPTHAAITLFYNQGKSSYTIEKPLEPDEQLWVDVGELIRDQMPDKDGKTIPPDVMMGSYELRDLDHRAFGYLFEGKLVLDKTWGHGYYGCAGCCGYVETRLDPNPLSGGVNTGAYNEADAKDCTMTWYDFTDQAYNWSSANTGIATVANAYTSFVGVGSTTTSTSLNLAHSPVRLTCPVYPFLPQNWVTSTPSITWNSSIISGTTQNAVVGEEIYLTGDPGGGTWSIGGNAVGGFNTGTPGGPETLVATSGTNVLFYWIVGANNTVTYTASGQSASVTFQIAAPTYGGVNVSTAGPSILSNNLLKLQSATAAGMTMASIVTDPSGFPGSVKWLQIQNSLTVTVTLSNNSAQSCPTANNQLDNAYPYTIVSPDGKTAYDSPSAGLNSGWMKVEDAGTYSMYLLWQPNLGSSIPVPLAVISWSWDGVANNASGTWLTSSPSAKYSVSATTSYPSWTNAFHNGQVSCTGGVSESASSQAR